MMYTSKGRYIVLTVLLFARSHSDLLKQQQQQYNPVVPPLQWHVASPWEHIAREIILKSVIPSPPDTKTPQRRPVDASFYGGPLAVYSNDDVNVVLSRGNVYHLLNGHWMLCQDGCIACEACVAQRNPSFKWILRRVKRLPASDPPYHDLQLTIMPQADEHFHASNLWPNSYMYVTSQGERSPFPSFATQHYRDLNSSFSLEDSFSERHHRARNPWQLTKPDSIAGHDEIQRQDDRVQENPSSTEKIEREESFERKQRFKNTRRPTVARPRPAEKPTLSFRTVRSSTDVTGDDKEEANQLAPKLILGTDQQGQKYLVYVVPADYPLTTAFPMSPEVSNRPISPQFAAGQATHSNKTIPKRERQTYQWIFRRVFDSLNTHRQSIENFLESPPASVDGYNISPSMDNTQAAEFSWNNRDDDHANIHFQSKKCLDNTPPAITVTTESLTIRKEQEILNRTKASQKIIPKTSTDNS